MDAEIKETLLIEAEKHALYNALKYQGPSQVKTVMGILMADYPNFRPFADKIPALIAPLIEGVNNLDNSTQLKNLTKLDISLAQQLEKEFIAVPKPQLPDLPNADSYDQIRMRVAPNPNGPWHIGHARMPSVIGTYKSIYDGWFVCRFDDTDPAIKRPLLEAYDWILEDIQYLGFEADEVIMASDRLDIYYEHALRLINSDGAYTCTCPSSKFSDLKNSGKSCPHRKKPIEQTLIEFQDMVDGNFSAGDIVLRVKTDLSHPNPAIRDWVAFRIVDSPHPRKEARFYRCWPLLDFQSAIDDYLLGITHIIRGIDLQDSARRQQYLYDYFNWNYPEVVHWGRIDIDDPSVSLSTSYMADSIKSGVFTGWSDLQLPTLQNLERRGIRGSSITSSMVELGTSTNNITLSISSIYSKNRSCIDQLSDRLFFIKNPVEKQIFGKGLPKTVEIPIHPDHPDRGFRELSITPSIYVDLSDLPPPEEILYLKGIGSVRYTRDSFEFIGGDFSLAQSQTIPIAHWLPSTHEELCLKSPHEEFNGIVESAICNYHSGDSLQFERVGFVKMDVNKEGYLAYFSHP